jgi:hypothetical protein
MMALDEIRRASAEQLAMEREGASAVSETSPSSLTPAIIEFAQSLEAGEAQFVPVIDDQHGLYGWCSDGVREKVKHDGGRCIFGWSIWEWPKTMLTAEFHSVWEDAEGNLLDITPKPKGEKRILFVPDRSYADDFDFDQRPRNRRKRLYVGADPKEKAAQLDAELSGPKRAYEERRAQKAGVSWDAWLLSKVPTDPLADVIDQLIATCDAFEEHFDSLGSAGLVQVDEKFQILGRRRMVLQEELKRQLKRLE